MAGVAAKNRRSKGKWVVKERTERRWVAEGLDEDLAPQGHLPRRWGNTAPGASLPGQAASMQPSAAGDEGWVVGTPWEQCRNGAVERPDAPGEGMPCPCHWRSPKNRGPGLLLVLVACCWLMT